MIKAIITPHPTTPHIHLFAYLSSVYHQYVSTTYTGEAYLSEDGNHLAQFLSFLGICLFLQWLEWYPESVCKYMSCIALTDLHAHPDEPQQG
jgi:hypothetical protein